MKAGVTLRGAMALAAGPGTIARECVRDYDVRLEDLMAAAPVVALGEER